MDTPESAIAACLRKQAGWCELLGSSLYAFLLEQAAADVEIYGPCWDVLRGHDSDPSGSALALRFMGAVHRVVLVGMAPELARHYPSMNGTPELRECWLAFRATVARHVELLREWICRPVQTNEVGRCAALIGGFLLVAHESNLPLRLIEIGSSAGLNLRWDHYYYEAGGAKWGDPASPVHLTGAFAAGSPPLDVAARVIERRGCDLSPVDPESEEGQLTLLSFVWADQSSRLAGMRGAMEVARKVQARVEMADAAQWLDRNLSSIRRGAATVVFHSIVAQYMSESGYKQVVDVLSRAGKAANKGAPLAWLRMEPGSRQADVRLTIWPEGEERIIATTSFHGRDIRWLIPEK
jgi:hypothetical protein